MKFLIVFALCAFYAQTEATFSHFHKGKSSGSAQASATTATNGNSGGHGNILGGLGGILAIPIGIKKQLLISHQKRFNKHMDHIINTLNKFSGNLAGSTSASASANANANAGIQGEIIETGNHNKLDTTFGVAHAETEDFSSATGGLSGSGGVGGFTDNAHFGGNYNSNQGSSFTTSLGSSGSSGFSSGTAETYHSQPAPQTQYKPDPITVHLFQTEAPATAEVYQPSPEEFQAPQSDVRAPANTYGPPNYQPPAPISTPDNTYLPPCNDATHTHRKRGAVKRPIK